MRKFNKIFTTQTKVQLPGEYGYRAIKSISDSRQLIEIEGVPGRFRRDAILTFTNRKDAEMYPATDDLYVADQYGAVYERGTDANHFIGQLNGKTLDKFVDDLQDAALYSVG